MGHENGGWMNDDQRSAVKDKADGIRQEWAARAGKQVCVTFVPVDCDEPYTESGKIIDCKEDEVRCQNADGIYFAFSIADVEDAANWRGTIIVKLKGAKAVVAGHTQEEWKVSDCGTANAPLIVYVGDKTPDYMRRFPMGNCDWIAEVRCDESPRHEEFKANARLIVAAPGLLCAAKRMVQFADVQAGGRAGRPEIVALRNAIEQAEGTV
jgi:hypothetical protein